ncbi:MAG: MFS transporter, partial [Gammaproteobacteria bacterium]|nr:MFS transporter [Gammaproteobacteria bacterium]
MAASSPAPTPSRRRAIVAASVGNALEWFDWTVYATFAIFFSSQFFPPGNETAALLAAYGIFAVGFIMRPLGGWVIGVFADRRGRKAALVLSILMMAGGSLVIGLSPTFAAVGIVAPVIL